MKDQDQAKDDGLNEALKNVQKNDHQDLASENLGNESGEKQHGDSDSPYKLKKSLDDKRPEDPEIKKGWTVDSNTSRDADDMKDGV